MASGWYYWPMPVPRPASRPCWPTPSTSRHSSAAKNDRIDSEKIAHLLRTNLIPPAYVYPAQKRPLRALLRQRIFTSGTAANCSPASSPINSPTTVPSPASMVSINRQPWAEQLLAQNLIYPQGCLPCKTIWPSSAITTRNWPASKRSCSNSLGQTAHCDFTAAATTPDWRLSRPDHPPRDR